VLNGIENVKGLNLVRNIITFKNQKAFVIIYNEILNGFFYLFIS